ncbi:MAG: hypothetical protein H0U52_17425 [Chloroflexi bacterium]|nr:hypothetical protein [Chloroflexota bacterium]
MLRRSRGGVAICSLAAVLLTACGTDPAGPVAVDSCPANLIEGVLEPLGKPGSIGIMEGSRHLHVTWVGGYRSAEQNGIAVVLSPAGEVVAQAGDAVRLTGGEIRPGEVVACGPPRLLDRG